MFLKPSEIRFSQDSIGNSFGGYTSHPFRRIGQTYRAAVMLTPYLVFL